MWIIYNKQIGGYVGRSDCGLIVFSRQPMNNTKRFRTKNEAWKFIRTLPYRGPGIAVPVREEKVKQKLQHDFENDLFLGLLKHVGKIEY